MAGAKPGARNHQWKGGRTIASNGYVLVMRPGHPMADTRGYVYEHRLVASEALGRPLLRGEIVHHKNGDKTDNRWPDNLEVVGGIAAHRAEHRTRRDLRGYGDPNPIIHCACGCGARLRRFDSSNRPRSFVSGHNVGRDAGGRFTAR